jgi:hypothetical protein
MWQHRYSGGDSAGERGFLLAGKKLVLNFNEISSPPKAQATFPIF